MPFLIDFEPGDTSQLSADFHLTIDATSLISGTYCVYSDEVEAYGNIEFTPSAEKPILFKTRISSDLNFPNDYESAYCFHLAEGNQTYDAGWLFYLRRFGESFINKLGILKTDYSVMEEIDIFSADINHDIEINYKAGESDGFLQIKIDDTQVFIKDGLANPSELMSCFHFGLISGSPTSGGQIYFDDITDDIGGGPILVDVGLNSETDTALALSKAKAKTAGLSSETDSSLALSKLKIKNTGLTTETNSAFSLSHSKIKDVGITSEADTVLSVDKEKEKAIGLSSSSEVALDIDSTKANATGLVIESDSVLSLSIQKTKDIALNVESDSALPVSFGKIIEIGIASETDTTQSLASSKIKETGIVTENDAAQNIDVQKTSEINYASETDAALVVDKDKEKELGIVSEIDSALAVTLATDLYNISFANGIFTIENIFEFDVMINSDDFNLGSYQVAIGFNQSIINGGILSMELIADSSDLVSNPPTAFCGVINPDGVYELGFASFPGEESITGLTRVGRFRVTNTNPFLMIQPELAFDFTGIGTTYIQDILFSNVTDQDLFESTLEFVLFNSLGIVSETDTALSISSEKIKETSLISEVDLALPVTFSRTIELGIAEEISFAQQLSSILKEYNIGLAEETDAAIRLAGSQFIELGLVTETDIALFVRYLNYDPAKLTADMIKGIFSSINSSGRFSSINPAAQFTSDSVKGIFEVIK